MPGARFGISTSTALLAGSIISESSIWPRGEINRPVAGKLDTTWKEPELGFGKVATLNSPAEPPSELAALR